MLKILQIAFLLLAGVAFVLFALLIHYAGHEVLLTVIGAAALAYGGFVSKQFLKDQDKLARRLFSAAWKILLSTTTRAFICVIIALGANAVAIVLLLRSAPPPRIVSFDAQATEIRWDEPAILSWTTQYADQVVLKSETETIPTTGKDPRQDSITVEPFRSTAYVLEASNEDNSGVARKELRIDVESPDFMGYWKSSFGSYFTITSETRGLTWRGYVIQDGEAVFLNYGAQARATLTHSSREVPERRVTGSFSGGRFPTTITWDTDLAFHLLPHIEARIAYEPCTVYGKWKDQNGCEFAITQQHEQQQSKQFQWTVPVQFETGKMTTDGREVNASTQPVPALSSWVGARNLTGIGSNIDAERRVGRIEWANGSVFTRIPSLPFKACSTD